MNTAPERLVRQRPDSRWEYCQLPQTASPLPHAIDHIIARQHQGPTEAENLALACYFCNSYKGPNVAGVNPRTGRREPPVSPCARTAGIAMLPGKGRL